MGKLSAFAHLDYCRKSENIFFYWSHSLTFLVQNMYGQEIRENVWLIFFLEFLFLLQTLQWVFRQKKAFVEQIVQWINAKCRFQHLREVVKMVFFFEMSQNGLFIQSFPSL